jgi:eukaryotic-like serine/threonine-protein kinase
MVQIKGAGIKEAITQIKTRAGEAAFQKILGLLDEETRKICEGEIFTSTWYPLDVFTRFLEIEVRVLANGNEEMITRGAEAVNEKHLTGIYKSFVKVGAPEFVIERIAAVHATYFQGVTVEVVAMEQGKALIKYTGFEKQHRIIGFAVIGFFNKALELSGAKDVVIHFPTPIGAGKAYCELSIAWS